MKQALIILITLLALASCKDHREEMLAKERKEMQVMLNNSTSVLYKGFKLTLRSAAADPSSHEAIQAAKLQELSAAIMSTALDDTKPAPGIGEYAAAAAELYSLKSSIASADEEKLPTIYENVLFVSTGIKPSPNGIADPKWYNRSTEHLLLAAVWMGSGKAPKEFEVYEAAAADPSQINDPLLKIGAEMLRAVVFYDQKWNYLAEDECTNYLADIEKAGPSIGSEFSYPIFPEAKLNTSESKYHQLHAAGLLMRGLCKQQSQREDEALEDFELFLQDMGQGGVSNESVWLIGTYVSLKHDKEDAALKYLGQLEQSDMFGEKEKKALGEIKAYITNNENDKAMSSLSDKIFMGTVTYHYASSLLESTDGYKQLKANETGKAFLELPGYISQGYKWMSSPVESIGEGIDSLGSKAADMMKGLFE